MESLKIQVILPGIELNQLFIGTNNGLFHSQNSGLTWQPVLFESGTLPVYSLIRDEQRNILIAGTANGVFLSSDEGITWRHIKGLNTKVLSVFLETKTNTLFIGTIDGLYQNKNYVSDGIFQDVRFPDKAQILELASNHNGVLFVGSSTGLYFFEGSKGWKKLPRITSQIDAIVFTKNENQDKLYVANEGNVFQIFQSGKIWQSEKLIHNGLPEGTIFSLAINNLGQLYAGTTKGIYKFTEDQKEAKKTAWSSIEEKLGVPLQPVYSLNFDIVSNTLISGQPESVSFLNFESSTGELFIKWRPLQHASFSPLIIQQVIYDKKNDWLYAIPASGEQQIFRTDPRIGNVSLLSDDLFLYRISPGRDKDWEIVGRGLRGYQIYSLLLSPDNHSILAWTDQGLFSYEENMSSWKLVSGELKDKIITGFIQTGSGNFIVSTNKGIYQSFDRGQHWQLNGFDGEPIKSIIWNDKSQLIFTVTRKGVYFSSGFASNWIFLQNVPNQFNNPWIYSDLLSSGCGHLVRLADNQLSWASCGGDILGQFYEIGLQNSQSFAFQTKANDCILLTVNQGRIEKYSSASTLCNVPGIYELGSDWIKISIVPRLLTQIPWLIGLSKWMLLLGSIFWLGVIRYRYFVYSQALGVPLWAIGLWFHPPFSQIANKDRLNVHWLSWKTYIQDQLMLLGGLKSEDLLIIPKYFRLYAIERFFSEYKDDLSLEMESGFIQYANMNIIRGWQQQILMVMQELSDKGQLTTKGIKSIDKLVQIMAQFLDFNIISSRSSEWIQAYLVEAPSLRLKLPLRFPILFISSKIPQTQVVKILVDTVDLLKDQGYFALIIPLSTSVTS